MPDSDKHNSLVVHQIRSFISSFLVYLLFFYCKSNIFHSFKDLQDIKHSRYHDLIINPAADLSPARRNFLPANFLKPISRREKIEWKSSF